MSYSTAEIWFIIVVLGVGTFLIRFSFLGLMGGRSFPPWALRYLRYTPVAVLPGLVAPLVLWPDATGGDLDPPRLMAGAATLIAGLISKSVTIAMGAGAATLYGTMYLLG